MKRMASLWKHTVALQRLCQVGRLGVCGRSASNEAVEEMLKSASVLPKASLRPAKRTQVRKATGRESICAAYCLGRQVDLAGASAIFRRESQALSLEQYGGKNEVLYARFEQPSGEDAPAHLFLFASGSVVDWGFDQRFRQRCLKLVQTFVRGPTQAMTPIDSFDHEFSYHVQENLDRPRFYQDVIVLPKDYNTEELLAISYGLALSVKLVVYEDVIDRLVEKTSSLPEELALNGFISMSSKEIKQRIGELLAARYSVNLLSDILDTPEFFWDHPELSSLFTHCTNEVELPKRTSILDKRMTVMKDMLDALNDELRTNSSGRVERAILLLIAIEVLLEVFGRMS
mmetsp:Transcript_10185/g.20559  ORF Transcript_10185/g.20559 Transcript_10185/m.20559 type:complete len:344 (-) Transcript_10185:2401-3432(-)